MDNFIQKRHSLGCMLLVLAMTFYLYPQKPSDETKKSITGKSILIAKGKSGLEYNVADIIRKKFEEHGYTVDMVPIRNFDKQRIDSYDAVLVMNAVKRKALSRQVQQAVSEMSEKVNSAIQPYLFIATVSGADWSGKKTAIDATTSASRKENAETIAAKIIRRLEGMLLPEE